MKSPDEKRKDEASSPAGKLSDEQLEQVSGGTQDQAAEQEINIGDLPNVRVDVTPM